MACRAALVTPFLWAAQQTIEKYLKCILLLNRIPATNVRHSLSLSFQKIQESGKVHIQLVHGTKEFIERIDAYGTFRYREVSSIGFGMDLVTLDRAVWELRRYCSLSEAPSCAVLGDGQPAPIVRIEGGLLEATIDSDSNPAREALLWQNAFFGRRRRKQVRLRKWFQTHNAPLFLHPEILDEVLKYVFLPKNVVAGYRTHKQP